MSVASFIMKITMCMHTLIRKQTQYCFPNCIVGADAAMQNLSRICMIVFAFFRIYSYHIVNSVCCAPASDGGLCSGQLWMMWSAVCSGSTHSRAALSASPHFFMDALYRPTSVRSLFRVVQCFRLRSSPLTPSRGSDTWRCTRMGPDVSHFSFHAAAIHAFFDRSSGMTLSIS